MRSAVAGLIAAGILTPGAAAADRELLERHRPLLRYDAQERDRTTAVDAIARRLTGDRVDLENERRGRELVYGRAVRDGDGETWLQYWLFFLTNDQDRGIVRTGRHEGDWELAQVRLNRGGRPHRVVLAQHSWAEGCGWDEIEHVGEAPVVYVANASHALYAKPGDHDRPFPDPTDEADGRGRSARPPVVPISERAPRWVAWPGRWGDSEARLPPEQSSPRGPAFQDDDRFRNPAAFAADRARDCGAGAPRRLWQWPLLGAILIAIAAAIEARRRATYNRPP